MISYNQKETGGGGERRSQRHGRAGSLPKKKSQKKVKNLLTNREKESILSTENKKGENKMEFYSMEQFEIMADAMEEVQDWLNFEADMETHPFD